MSKLKQRDAATVDPGQPVIVADPPRPNKWLLGISALLWLTFLLVLIALAINS